MDKLKSSPNVIILTTSNITAAIERRRPTISVWNKDYLCRREYLELNDGGFGTWPFIRHEGMHEDRSWPDVFAERSVNPKVSSKSKLQKSILPLELSPEGCPTSLVRA
ncbi:uncharacterized protein LOC112510757 [Cynara cardunculus var. scolymus]|uniref:uncharacterized protein LOC112510757 n=1 Tax=Cynara cardunculus var. scolymus TaxID=59895 RepID=UPI000D62A425|nr:uncharacterized protein LOC112510757 [Cynara cardunculus var. scolymus]